MTTEELQQYLMGNCSIDESSLTEKDRQWLERAKLIMRSPEEKPLKYRNKPVKTEDGYFHSTSEKQRWEELQNIQERGWIHQLQRQVKIEVVPGVFWEMGGKFLSPIFWIADFLYYDSDLDSWVVEDFKSEKTAALPEYKMKRQLFLLKYPEFHFIESQKKTVKKGE